MNFEIKKDVLAMREQWRKRQDYGCFWSSPDNERGLRLTPIIEPGRLYLDLEIERFHSGFPGIANGGVSFTILDGMMSWYLMSHFGRAGFTKNCTVDYFRPLHVGQTYRFQVTAGRTEMGQVTDGTYELLGQVLHKPVAGVVVEAQAHLEMRAVFILPNRATAKKVLKIKLNQDGEELFPE